MMRFTTLTILALSVIGCGTMSSKREEATTPRQQLQDPRLLLERGKAFAEVGDNVRAEQYFAAAIAAGGDQKEILPPLLRACVASGNVRLASEYAETALAKSPNDAHLRFLTGALQATVGNRVSARTHLVRAASDLPKDAEVQFAVAAFFRDTMIDLVEADQYFRAYLKLAPRGEHAEEARASIMQDLQGAVQNKAKQERESTNETNLRGGLQSIDTLERMVVQ